MQSIISISIVSDGRSAELRLLPGPVAVSSAVCRAWPPRRGPAASAVARRRQIVERRVLVQPLVPRLSLHQQPLAVVGLVPYSLHRTAGSLAGQQVQPFARQLDRVVVPLPAQSPNSTHTHRVAVTNLTRHDPSVIHRFPRAIFLPPCADPHASRTLVYLASPPLEQRVFYRHHVRAPSSNSLVTISLPISKLYSHTESTARGVRSFGPPPPGQPADDAASPGLPRRPGARRAA